MAEKSGTAMEDVQIEHGGGAGEEAAEGFWYESLCEESHWELEVRAVELLHAQ